MLSLATDCALSLMRPFAFGGSLPVTALRHVCWMSLFKLHPACRKVQHVDCRCSPPWNALWYFMFLNENHTIQHLYWLLRQSPFLKCRTILTGSILLNYADPHSSFCYCYVNESDFSHLKRRTALTDGRYLKRHSPFAAHLLCALIFRKLEMH